MAQKKKKIIKKKSFKKKKSASSNKPSTDQNILDTDNEELNGFIYNPKKYIPGTKMNFAGLKKVQDRADLIFWLRQFSDEPVPFP